MTALLIVGGVMGLCLIIILGAVPELLAGTLTAGAILIPYYTLQERTPEVDSFMYENRHITPEPLEIRQHDDGQPYVVTSPLPEYVTVDAELWGAAEPYDPSALPGDNETPPGPPPLWVETVHNGAVGQTDPEGNLVAPDARHDYVLHIDASNVTASYRLVAERPDGNRLLQLHSWGEQ